MTDETQERRDVAPDDEKKKRETVIVNGREENVSDLWQTPASLIAFTKEYFGIPYFDMDACAMAHTAVAPEHLGHQHDGTFKDAMTHPWNPKLPGGTVWVNPPYSSGNLLAFAQRALTQFGTATTTRQDGLSYDGLYAPHCDRIIFLGKLDPSTKWFKLLARSPRCHETVMLSPRVHFVNPLDGKPQRGTNFCSVLFDLRRSTAKRKTISLAEFER